MGWGWFGGDLMVVGILCIVFYWWSDGNKK
jgi:hypothetical protein